MKIFGAAALGAPFLAMLSARMSMAALVGSSTSLMPEALPWADSFGLAFGGFNDQADAVVVGEGLVKLEGEGITLAHDSGGGRILHTQEGRRYENRLATAGDDPVVQPDEQVGAGNLGTGAEDMFWNLCKDFGSGRVVIFRCGLQCGLIINLLRLFCFKYGSENGYYWSLNRWLITIIMQRRGFLNTLTGLCNVTSL